MSRVRANKLTNRAGSGAPELTYGAEVPVGYGITGAGGINISGMVTATAGFAGDATGLTGTPDINVRNIVGVGATFSGVLNYEDVTNVDSVGLVTARAGIEVTGIITARSGTAVTFTGGLDLSNAQETVSTGSTTHYLTNKSVTVELDCLNGTVFTHSLANGNVGIVSIKNFPAVKNSFHTVTLLLTQNSSTPTGGIGNTMVAGVPGGFPGGIGTHIQLTPRGVTGFSTDARVGSATTVVLSSTAKDLDIVTFGIHYNGSTNTNANNYTTIATKNGDFRVGGIGQ
tara:strand:+ start:524 stop:1378 length:855 start_codon:yes stop_codon:yes gene_type:complete